MKEITPKTTLLVNYLDVVERNISTARVSFADTILEVEKMADTPTDGLPYLVPGLIDSHVHIESSMLVPQRFASMVIPHGTIGVVCDPHEIANVLGEEGVRYMMDDAAKSPLHFYFGLPSCVPATPFETNGAEFGPEQIRRLMPRAVALAEMMNYPGLLGGDPKVLEEMQIAKEAGKPVDGHIPGITDERLKSYVAAGVSTDHESYELSEAQAKIDLGMKILIREGSAARNLAALEPLFSTNIPDIMACTDDAHPDDIEDRGHIDKFYRRARQMGIDVFDIFRVLTLNPIEHYHLDAGRGQVGDAADFVLISDMDKYDVRKVYIGGHMVFADGNLTYQVSDTPVVNNFADRSFTPADFRILAPKDRPTARVIGLIKDQLVSQCKTWETTASAGEEVKADVEQDVLKISVINRYSVTAPVVNGFISGVGMKRGAMAASIAHDSHNVVVIGTDDEVMAEVANEMFRIKGGIVLSAGLGSEMHKLELPVAGLMTTRPWQEVATDYRRLVALAQRECGTTLASPFMTMAFMSLLVIPSLKIGDRGLFDVDKFEFVELFS